MTDQATTLKMIDVYGLIRQACRDAGGQHKWAEQVGVTPAFVSALLHGRRNPSKRILDALGVRKVVTFHYTQQAAE